MADNLAIHVAVAEAPSGHVLVASVGAEPERGYWGEVLTTGAEARGLIGLVIDGGVRDVSALEAHGFPAFSSMIALRGANNPLESVYPDAFDMLRIMSCTISSGASKPNTARLPMFNLIILWPSSSICLAFSRTGPRMS